MISSIRISLVMLCLLAAAPSAPAAECSWVLWSKKPSAGAYHVHSAYTTKKECKRAAAVHDNQSDHERATYWRLPVGAEPGASGLREPVDPRGLKGK
jgi:hypothetical protein